MNLLKKSKWFLIILFIVSIAFISIYKFAYKPHKNIEELTVNYKGSSKIFYSKMIKNPTIWLNKIVELSGKITALDTLGLVLNENIFCQFKKSIHTLEINQNVTIKGQIIGYDDLLDELKINQCIIKNN